MFGIKTQKRESYSAVKSEDSEGLLANSETSSLDGYSGKISVRRQSWIATSIMIFCTAVVSALFGAWAGRYGLDADVFSMRHISEYCKFELQTLDWIRTDIDQLLSSRIQT